MPISDAPFLFKEMLKMRRREMSPGNRKRTQSPNITTIWLYPYAIERQYYKYVADLLDVYSDITLPTLKSNLQRWVEERVDSNSTTNGQTYIPVEKGSRIDDFQTEFQQLINELEKTQSDMFTEDGEGIRDDKGNFYNKAVILSTLSAIGFSVSKFNQKQGDKFTKKILGQSFIVGEQQWLFSVVDLWANNNFGLIKSLSNEYIKKLNYTVSEGVMEGRTWDAILKDVRKMDKNITRTRAKLLTSDQIGKLNGQLAKRRMQNTGNDIYKWLTALDERVRPTDPKLASSTSVPNHRLMNGTLNKWSDPTVMSEDGGETWKKRPSLLSLPFTGST